MRKDKEKLMLKEALDWKGRMDAVGVPCDRTRNG
jgi:hypothetical protein